MNTTNRFAVLALALAFAATGCSAADPSSMGDDGGGGGGGGGGGDDQPKPLDATGTYTMHSTFDLATNMPGTAGTVVNTIIAATDDPDDPTRWIVDQILTQLPDGTLKTGLELGKEAVVGFLNQKLLDVAPDFLSTMVQVGNDFGDIAKHFGLNETLVLTKTATGYTAVHTVTGVHYKLGNQEGDFALTNYHVANVVVSNVGVTMDETGQLTIAAHSVPLAYGKLLKLGLDAAIIPLIDSSARNLNELLAHKIDCTKVGNAIGEKLGFGATTFRTACTTALGAGANFVYTRIDAIQTGAWSGTLAYGASPTPLVPATFFGERK